MNQELSYFFTLIPFPGINLKAISFFAGGYIFMHVLRWILLCLAAYVLALLLFNSFVSRKGEPPIYWSFIPYTGHGLNFKFNYDTFVQKVQILLGNVYVLILGGRRVIVVLDDSYLKSILKNKDLTFSVITFAARVNGQGLRAEDWGKIDQKARRSIEVNGLSNEGLRGLFKRATECCGTTSNVERYLLEGKDIHLNGVTEFQELLKEQCPHALRKKQQEMAQCDTSLHDSGAVMDNLPVGTYKMVDLFELARYFIFDTFSYCFFGDSLDNQCFLSWKALSKYFDIALIGFPYQRYWFLHYFKNLKRIENGILALDTSLWSPVMLNRAHFHEESGVYKWKSAGVLDAWYTGITMAAQPLFWMMAHAVTDKTLKQDILDELRIILPPEKALTIQSIQLEDVAKLRSLDALQLEVFRYYTTISVARAAINDCTIASTSDAPSYKIRKGDWVTFHPRFSLHRNGCKYSNPGVFDPKRFLRHTTKADDEERPLGFVDINDLLPFGGGRHLCPGRHFATAVMKLIVLYVLLHLDTVVPSSSKFPNPNVKGTEGTSQPLSPYYVFVKPK